MSRARQDAVFWVISRNWGAGDRNPLRFARSREGSDAYMGLAAHNVNAYRHASENAAGVNARSPVPRGCYFVNGAVGPVGAAGAAGAAGFAGVAGITGAGCVGAERSITEVGARL